MLTDGGKVASTPCSNTYSNTYLTSGFQSKPSLPHCEKLMGIKSHCTELRINPLLLTLTRPIPYFSFILNLANTCTTSDQTMSDPSAQRASHLHIILSPRPHSLSSFLCNTEQAFKCLWTHTLQHTEVITQMTGFDFWCVHFYIRKSYRNYV